MKNTVDTSTGNYHQQAMRIDYIDISKGIGIFFIILVHMTTFFDLKNNILYAGTPFDFVMAFFFFVPGITYIVGKRSVKENIVRRIKGGMFPLWKHSILITLYVIVFIILISGFDKTFLIQSLGTLLLILVGFPQPLALAREVSKLPITVSAKTVFFTKTVMPFWFLTALVSSSIIFFMISGKLNKKKNDSLVMKVIVVILLLMLSWIEEFLPWQIPFGIGRAGIGCALMLTAFWLNERGVFSIKSRQKNIILSVAAFIICFVLAKINPGSELIGASHYGPYGWQSVLLAYLIGVSGSIWYLQACKLLDHILAAPAKNLIISTGKNSFTFYLFHYPVITTITSIMIKLSILPVTGKMFSEKLLITGFQFPLFNIGMTIIVMLICLPFVNLVTKKK